MGIEAIALFMLLRSGNFYGDPAPWHAQKNYSYSVLSFLNVTKYPPSLLYTLIMLGPSLIFLSLTEKPLRRWTARVAVFGRVPMFYYIAHLVLIHLLAMLAAGIPGDRLAEMTVLSTPVNDAPELKGYGYNLATVYVYWMAVVVILYPMCKAFDRYKKLHQSQKRWLSYI